MDTSGMIERGHQRAWKAVAKARDHREESGTSYGAWMIGQSVDQYADVLKEFSEQKGAGRGHRAITAFAQLDAHVLAFLAMQAALDGISRKHRYTNIAVSLGRRIEDEIRFNTFATNNVAFWETLRKDLKKREPNLKRRRGILKHEMKKGAQTQESLVWEEWTTEFRLIVGSRALDLLLAVRVKFDKHSDPDKEESYKHIVERVTVGHGKKKYFALAGTEATQNFVKALVEERSGVMEPQMMPTVTTPIKWVNPFVGGYPPFKGEFHDTDDNVRQIVKRFPLVKTRGENGNNYLEELANRVSDMPMVYRAVNAVQETPWKINKGLLDVLRQAYKTGLEIGDMPCGVDMPIPPKLPATATDEELTARNRKAALAHAANAQRASRMLQMETILGLAERYLYEPSIYFPMQLDFRGRMYAMPSFLNPQGNDPAKALLTFANSKPLGKSGLRWLRIHVANNQGEDKVSLDAREQWSITNYAWMAKCVSAPFEHREWMDADKPWQFLAAAQELVAAIESGNPEGHESSLPISVDGTCNGLQHFAAMCLDPEGAHFVNLSPSEKPQDIYQRVADLVKTEMQKDALNGVVLAQEWLEEGFDRKSCKRIVMIVPYSGTEYAAKDYTRDYIADQKITRWEDSWAASIYFTRKVWQAIDTTITSAREAMVWLQGVSKVVSVHGAPMVWTTPVGFPVVQDYRKMTSYQVNTRLGDGIRYVPRLQRESRELDPRSQANAISPNFVHSLDAASLMLTVCKATDDGIKNFAMVHDSYGVLAADMDTLYAGLRQAFVDIYQNDVMGDFLKSTTSSLNDKEQKKLPPMPTKGTFVLESVKDSKYFFA